MMRANVGETAWDQYLRQKTEQVRQDLERTMRGEGGWLWLRGEMTLADACERYVPLLGTDEMFEEF
jgi:hypothetical protein